jgi:5-methyltetrahydropteroyltriglutamate--homocysteine methyltransferase
VPRIAEFTDATARGSLHDVAVHNTDRILTTHVGSLVRPPEFRRILEARRDGGPFDQAEYERVLRRSVIDVVRKQAQAGVDVVSDGEFGKSIHWAAYVLKRLSGLEYRETGYFDASPMRRSKDMIEFPDFYPEYMANQGFENEGAGGWHCVGELTYTGQDELRRDIDNLKAGLAEVDVVGGFLPVVAPASVAGIDPGEGPYATEEEFIYAVAEALRVEYTTILDAGLTLQIDDAFLPWTYDLMVPPATMEEYRAWAQLRVDALNHALRGLPEERIRYHICWGSFNVPHVGDVPAKDIIDLVLQVRASSYLIEMANPRHEHEWRVWEDVRLPDGKVLIPGVITHQTNVVEHPELVAERLTRLARLVGRENVQGGTDCGFSQGPFAARVHESIQWAKLRSLSEGAEIATRELWGAGVPA